MRKDEERWGKMKKNEEKRKNEWKKEKESYKTVSNLMHTQQKPGTLVAS